MSVSDLVPAARVIVVEDDPAIRDAVAAALTGAGHRVRALPDGASLEQELTAFRPDLVLLDWMLPGRDGPTLARVVRSTSGAGVVLLTAREAVADRLLGFEVGADDYVAKPFVMEELLARVRAVLRRLGALAQVLEIGDLVVDEDAGVALRAGTRLDLTATEFRLLVHLAQNRGRVLSTAQILTQVWGYDDYADNLVQVHVSALRRKLESLGPRLVHTERGLGYVLKVAS